MRVLGRYYYRVVELVVHFVDVRVQPGSVKQTVRPVEHEVFADHHEEYLACEYRKARNVLGFDFVLRRSCLYA